MVSLCVGMVYAWVSREAGLTTGRRIAPPPTKYGQGAPAQAKAARPVSPPLRPATPPPPIPAFSGTAVQRKAILTVPAAPLRLQPPPLAIPRRVVQRMTEMDTEEDTTTLAGKAKEIWQLVSSSARGAAGSTIAVIECTDGKFYCTSNDISSISSAAKEKAKALGITGGIQQAGAGFHAEMWAVLLAINDVRGTLKKVGASRACCKYCTAVLKIYGIEMEQESSDLYKSWYNPMTMDEECSPRVGFESKQRTTIPDFRNHSKDYWFTSSSDYGQEPPKKKK